MTKRLAAIGGIVALAGIAGCGGLPRAPSTPDPALLTAEAGPTLEGLDEDPPQPLALYPGDRVGLQLQSAETTEVEGLIVDEQGNLHVPLAGDVQVAGMPLGDAEQRIEQALRRFDRTVRVGIIVREPLGHQASVVGAVNEQGRVTVIPGMRLADLFAAAGGGVTSEGSPRVSLANLALSRLVRDGRAVPVSLARALEGDPRHNVRIRPGDQLFVPAELGGLISIVGEVNGARVIPPSEGLRLSQALAMAGGYTRDANYGDIRIVRGPRESPTVYRAALDHIADGDHIDPLLAPGDIVLVGSSALADFRDGMGALAPVLTIISTGAFIGAAFGTGP